MNLKEQLYVCTLAETKNMTQAAKQLYISQPALSLYISNLEKTLGIRLFERIGNQFELTMAGELYIEKAKKMLELKNSFNTALTELKHGQYERIRVGIQGIRSSFLTPAVIPTFSKQFPQIKIVWVEDNLDGMEQMLLDNQLDIVFCTSKSPRKELEYKPLFNDEIVFICSDHYPQISESLHLPGRNFPWINLALFQNERFILNLDTQSLRKFSNQILASHGIVPKSTFILRDIPGLIALVNTGYGVGFVQTGYLNRNQNMNHLCIFSILDSPVTATFCAIHRKGHCLTQAEHSLIELVQKPLNAQIHNLTKNL